MTVTKKSMILGLLASISLLPVVLAAQEANEENSTENATTQSSFLLGNPNDIAEQARTDRLPKGVSIPTPRIDEALRPLYEFRDRMNNEHGLLLTISATHLAQRLSSTVGTEKSGSGYELVVEGTWTPFRRGTPSATTIGFETFAVNRLGTEIAPVGLVGQAGSLWPTAVAFDQIGPIFGQLWLQQKFQNRIGFRAGRLFPISAYDYFPLKNFRTDFLDGIHAANLVIPLPRRGLGGFVMYKPVPNVYIKAGLHDANASTTRSGFETFFDRNEYFKILELGFDPGIVPRQPPAPPFGDIHVSLWHQDEREIAGVEEGWGIAFSANQRFGRFLPFFRYGYSDSGATGPSLIKHSVNFGFAIDEIIPGNSDRFGIGFTWADPANPALNEQKAIDAYYRHQLTNRVAISPTLQVIIDPILNPESPVYVAGFRTRYAL